MAKYLIDFITGKRYEIHPPHYINEQYPREIYGTSFFFSSTHKRFAKRYKELFDRPKLFIYYDDRKPVVQLFVRVLHFDKILFGSIKLRPVVKLEVMNNLETCEYIDGHQDWVTSEKAKYKNIDK